MDWVKKMQEALCRILKITGVKTKMHVIIKLIGKNLTLGTKGRKLLETPPVVGAIKLLRKMNQTHGVKVKMVRVEVNQTGTAQHLPQKIQL